MIKLVFLGTSASAPSIGRGMPSVAIIRDGDAFLLDCGEGTQRQMLNFGISYAKIKAIFLSHLHLDHTLGVFGLLETIRLHRPEQTVVIAGPKGTHAIFASKKNAKTMELKTGSVFDAGGFTLKAIENKHGPRIESFAFAIEEKPKTRFYEQKAKSLGLRGPLFTQIQKDGKVKIGTKTIKLKDVTYVQAGKKIVYSGDTAPCASISSAAKKADLLIHEATFSDDEAALAKERFHSTASDAAKIAKKAHAGALILTHISGRYANAEPLLHQAIAIFPKAQVAHDGLVSEL